jgi:SAM-dependent methyltransferase
MNKPDTLKTTNFKELIKVNFLSNHIKIFKKNEKTLDIGCGWGFSLKINPDFYVCDADDQCINYLKDLGYKALKVYISEGGLPYKNSFFDNAFTHDVCEHLEEEEMLNLFKEVRRILKPGGYFMNVVPNKKGYIDGLNPLVGHKRFIGIEQVQKCANATDFELIKYWYTPLPKILSELFVHNKLVTLCKAIN